MAVPQLMAGKRRRHQHQRIGLWIVDTGQRTQLGKAGIVQRGGQQVVKRADHANTPGRSCGTDFALKQQIQAFDQLAWRAGEPGTLRG